MGCLGIDPGQDGGIAIQCTGNPMAFKIPKTEADINDLFESLAKGGVEFAVIEKVHTMPDQGIHSAGLFMQGYGFLRGMLIAHKIPFVEVSPQHWQKDLNIPPRRKKPNEETHVQFKNRLKAKAQQLFPNLKITLATCDALLIAEYCRRIYGQKQQGRSSWDDL